MWTSMRKGTSIMTLTIKSGNALKCHARDRFQTGHQARRFRSLGSKHTLIEGISAHSSCRHSTNSDICQMLAGLPAGVIPRSSGCSPKKLITNRTHNAKTVHMNGTKKFPSSANRRFVPPSQGNPRGYTASRMGRGPGLRCQLCLARLKVLQGGVQITMSGPISSMSLRICSATAEFKTS